MMAWSTVCDDYFRVADHLRFIRIAAFVADGRDFRSVLGTGRYRDILSRFSFVNNLGVQL